MMVVQKTVDPGSLTPFAFIRRPGPFNKKPVSAVVKVGNLALANKIGAPLVNVQDEADHHVYVQIKNIEPNETVKFQLVINYGTTPTGQVIELVEDVTVVGSSSPLLTFTIEPNVILGSGHLGGGGGGTGFGVAAEASIVYGSGELGGGGGGLGQAIILQPGIVLGSGELGAGGRATGNGSVVQPGIVLGIGQLGGGGRLTGAGGAAAVTPTPILSLFPEAEMEGDIAVGRVIKSDGTSYGGSTTWHYSRDGGPYTLVTTNTPVRIAGDVVTMDIPTTGGATDTAHTLQLRATETGKDQSANSNTITVVGRAANSVTLAHRFLGDELVAAGWTHKVMCSFFRQFATYTGPAIRVTRLSDNATQDIGFDGDNKADEAAILSFIGNASATFQYYRQAPGTSTGTLATVPAGLSAPLIAQNGVLLRDPHGNLRGHCDSASRVLSFGTGHTSSLSDYFMGFQVINHNAVQSGYAFTGSTNQDTVTTKDGRSVVIQGHKARVLTSTPTTAAIGGLGESNLWRWWLRFGGETLGDTLSGSLHANGTSQASRETVRQSNIQFNANAISFVGMQTQDSGSDLILNGTVLHTANVAAHTPSSYAARSSMEFRLNQGFSGSWGGGSGGTTGAGGNHSYLTVFLGSRLTGAQLAIATKVLHQQVIRRSLARVPVATEVFDFTAIVGGKIDGVGTDLTLTGLSWVVNSTNQMVLPGLTGPARTDTFTSAQGFANRFQSDATFGTAYPNIWTGPGKLQNEFTAVMFLSTPATAFTSGDILDFIAMSTLPVGTNNGENTAWLMGRDHTTWVSWTRHAGMVGDIFSRNALAYGAQGVATVGLGGKFQGVLTNVTWNSGTRIATANCAANAHGLTVGGTGIRDIVDPLMEWSGKVTITALSTTQIQWSVPAGKNPTNNPPRQICMYKNDKDEIIPANAHTGLYVNKGHMSQEQNDDYKYTAPMLTNQAYCFVLKHKPSPGQDNNRSTLELAVAQMFDATGFGGHLGWRTYKFACARRAAITSAMRWVDANGLFLAAFDGWRHGLAFYDHWLSTKQTNAVLLNGLNLNNLKAA